MHAHGLISELNLIDGLHAARITCPSPLVPSPGQYVLAYPEASSGPLAAALYSAQSLADGFLTVPGLPQDWREGTTLQLKGPLGHGLILPESARHVALVAWDDGPRRLLALLEGATQMDASIALVSEMPPDELPLQVEVLPLASLPHVLRWADYVAFDAARESLSALGKALPRDSRPTSGAQVLVRTRMPCGGLAKCGVCTVRAGSRGMLACEDGPVFDLNLLDLEA